MTTARPRIRATAVLLLAIASIAATPAFAGLFGGPKPAPQTQIQYLSGTDKDCTVDWEFLCSAGHNSGVWTKIAVPSCWEMKGFGSFNYGRDLRKDGLLFDRADEQGKYKFHFSVPPAWKNRTVRIVFEGAMTDTEVSINGKSAGPVHQGGFYRFKYDVTALLDFKKGNDNLLEATVSKMSADHSINEAERAGDYWIYGGIYRPVYLEALPTERIERAAIDAKADGAFTAKLTLTGAKASDKIVCEIAGASKRVAATIKATGVEAKDGFVLKATVPGIQTWSAETPVLYTATFRLMRGRKVLHETTERFGFRTVEVRPGKGVFINGNRVMFKGSCRHSSWPDSGRTLSRAVHELDADTMKGMNMNAVRMTHYPPDADFLEVCDEQGLYVLDELAGWHWAYDTEIGKKLVREMVERDGNHPSIVFWDNGNEGGANHDLDPVFGEFDAQQRVVIAPTHQEDRVYGGIDTQHYPNYARLTTLLKGPNLVMPCELLHALYDGGGGASLGEYWDAMRASPYGAGAFMWAYADETIRRPDRYNQLDSHLTDAPDGIVGPYREKEGSYYAIKQIWSPVHVAMDALPENFDGTIPVENRYDFSDLSRCAFHWELINWTGPRDREAIQSVIQSGDLPGPAAAPGASASLKLALPSDWQKADALSLTARDWEGRELLRWTWPVRSAEAWMERIVTTEGPAVAAIDETDAYTLNCEKLLARILKADGRLQVVKRDRRNQPKTRVIDFGNGPAPAVGEAKLTKISNRTEGAAQVVEAEYTGALKSVKWTLYGSGWLKLNYAYHAEGPTDFLGVNFDFPEKEVASARWVGGGPYRVWKNRLEGSGFGLWTKPYNNTLTGRPGALYPEFKGYHRGVYWASLETTQGWISIVDPRGDGYLRLYTPPAMPKEFVSPPFPEGSISWLDAIPPIGQKGTPPFDEAGPKYGPASAQATGQGDYARELWFYFGTE